MRVKRYEAENMATALRIIRDDMGPNAFVLSTRRIKRKDKYGQLKTFVEVSAASDVVQVTGAPDDVSAAHKGSEARELASLQEQVDRLKRELAGLKREQPTKEIKGIQQDLLEIKELVEFATDQWAEESIKEHGPILGALFRRLKNADIDQRIAARLIAITAKELSGSSKVDEKESLKVLFDVMKRQMLTSGPISLLESGPKTVVVIGPTGVGKTTTLAKIAAQYTMLKKKKVGLLTIDTFRIGAVEQLKTYANILELPLRVADTPEQMRQYVADFSDMDLVLIDTGGSSQKDRTKMTELLNFVGGRNDMYYEVHLLLSGASKNRDLVEITREFGRVPTDYVIFTKLDECNSFGGIFNEVVWTQKPVSYLTTGQNVPDDIELAEPGRIVEFVLTNSFRKRAASGERASEGQ
ncbi:MAG: flagellar biosynthesis protein FlhF [Candidatus Coatesbacteria bacterium]|nr:flagellar biosynthesis protein FlhF [Candidatus Coatesbacteria bacterium]